LGLARSRRGPFLKADGSVQMLKHSVSFNIMEKLIKPRDRGVLSRSDY
jgi:hypothetical protein